MKTTGSAARYTHNLLQIDPQSLTKEPYIKPSSLARGCMLYVAFELRGEPKPPLDARVGRILSVGIDSHRRLPFAVGPGCAIPVTVPDDNVAAVRAAVAASAR